MINLKWMEGTILRKEHDKAVLCAILAALLLGFVAYGLSIFLYVYAQRELGAAKTSAYYAVAPFIGVALSFILFTQIPKISFVVALLIMIVGTYFALQTVNKLLTII